MSVGLTRPGRDPVAVDVVRALDAVTIFGPLGANNRPSAYGSRSNSFGKREILL
jgi:hypothetical protein